MSEDCNQNCSSCGEECSDRKETSLLEKLNDKSRVGKVIAVVSGKGGVGKSSVTSMLAVNANRNGYHTAILDADITGPSIPKAFGITSKAYANDFGLLPIKSATGIDIMSVNLLLENDTDPVIWRGPIISSTVKQFWSDVIWEDIDYMFIDMPPGTGDVSLTVFQSIKVDGIIIVTSPQELVSMIVTKAVKMANMMDVPILGIVENMSYFECTTCGEKHEIFGKSNLEKIAKENNIKILARLPIDKNISKACDEGAIESFKGDWFDDILNKLEKKGEEKMKIAVASEKELVTEHFGHCINFNIYEAVDDKIVKSESLDNPGHRPGFLPNFLSDLGVNVIISGGMGGGAVEIFNEKGIEVVTGVHGKAIDAAEQYLQGNLESTGSICHEHIHHDECAEHSDQN
jgi:Mrp family chromosome partitioning ATPase/predicted Fe-Mo cluster-binding NifX family protein